jgi:hypothetical protein
LQRPSAVQARAIGPLMRGRDLIVQSQSGTGKTAVFSIGILQVIDAKNAACQVRVWRRAAQTVRAVCASSAMRPSPPTPRAAGLTQPRRARAFFFAAALARF